ncbi:cell envelope integrity protein TolA [Serratia ureilytica]|uniref:cell envelope integrity protein TolA n=1 Tax=Serratia ureilytica TaxID=300181 RepID=UPI0019CFF057|nr:cell envelope integrity protein TolA [Serratia ureilytica]MBN5281234.1 cell envelope integrity protein TolA [Serratia ureilytica]MBN5371394.1 cell envelope integrity protein TolA [Serratia ureilytica]
MKITHSGYKTGVATLLAGMFALALTGCAKSTAPSQTDPVNKEVDDLFANLGNPKAPGKEKEHYIAQLQAAIQSHLKDAEAYSGRSCTLSIKLAPDGMLISIRAEQGEPELCQAAIKAIANARLPKPPTTAVYEAVKSSTLEFRPQ